MATVKIRVVCEEGDRVLTQEAAQAVQTCQHAGQDYWVILDGLHTPSAALTEEALERAQDITLTPRLVGG
jgi:hypothetical protein